MSKQKFDQNSHELTLDLPLPGGIIKKVAYRQYVLNNSQQFAVIAADFDSGIIELGAHSGIEYFNAGKLRDQSVIFQHQIVNSLTMDAWDFEENPNPEIVIITKK
jgi:hypothetical protein